MERKAFDKDAALTDLLAMSNRLLAQKKSDKNKLYSIHEPSVRCITKGKVYKRYEFGNTADVKEQLAGGRTKPIGQSV